MLLTTLKPNRGVSSPTHTDVDPSSYFTKPLVFPQDTVYTRSEETSTHPDIRVKSDYIMFVSDQVFFSGNILGRKIEEGTPGTSGVQFLQSQCSTYIGSRNLLLYCVSG